MSRKGVEDAVQTSSRCTHLLIAGVPIPSPNPQTYSNAIHNWQTRVETIRAENPTPR